MPSTDAFPSIETSPHFNIYYRLRSLRTIYDDLDIIHKSANDFESLDQSHSTFFLRETVQPA